MKWLKMKGWLAVSLSGLMILLSVVLISLQWGNTAEFSLYGQNQKVNTLVLMIACIVGGVVLAGLFRLLLAGVRMVRRAGVPPQPPPAK